jgi:hypothetical protein
MSDIQLNLTLDQAKAVSQALELLNRVGMGQINYLNELVDSGVIPANSNITVSNEIRASIKANFKSIKSLLGFPEGGSYGIGNRNVPMVANHAYEVYKVLAKAIHIKSGNKSFNTTDSDGLILRYTNEEAPTAIVLNQSNRES